MSVFASQFEDAEEDAPSSKSKPVITSPFKQNKEEEEPKYSIYDDAEETESDSEEPFVIPEFHRPRYYTYLRSLPPKSEKDSNQASSQNSQSNPSEITVLECILCGEKYTQTQELAKHMLAVHNLVIHNMESIPLLSSYLSHYRTLFTQHPITLYTHTIVTQLTPQEGVKEYYMLSEEMEHDKKLREELKQIQLAQIINKQQEERKGPFNRTCLFCRKNFTDRNDLFLHMFQIHSFNIGLPDNLINLNQFLDILQSKIEKCICIYCEKTFKNASVLKLHMRKKKHFRINGKNTEYDKFYLVNFLVEYSEFFITDIMQKNANDSANEKDSDDEEEGSEDDDWDDWQEEQEEDASTKCLFCAQVLSSPDNCLQHCKQSHNFDFDKINADFELDFYARMKLINYIRSKVAQHECIYCDSYFKNDEELLKHLELEGHFNVKKEAAFWEDSRYLTPSFNNDPLLYSLGTEASDDENDFDDDNLHPVPQYTVDDLEEYLRNSRK